MLAASLVVALALGLLVGPERQHVSTARSGDRALAERVERALGGATGGWRSLAVAEVTPDTVTWAGLGNAGAGRGTGVAPLDTTPYELGSITKTFTGSLLAQAIERGEARAEDPLASHLPELRGTPAGGVTLASLAQHSSGLPPIGATAAGSGFVASWGNEGPYASTSTAQLLRDAAAAPVDTQQPPTYSNLGFSLLGTALARAAGAPDYATLLRDRVTGPLGMADTGLAATPADIPADAAPGFHVNGLPAPRWDGEGYLPSGTATFTTLADLARWAQSQLGDGPGVAAQRPTAEMDGSGIGWAWVTTDLPAADGRPARELLWHNGGTGGFRTMLALDRAAGRGVIVLGNTTQSVDALGVALLEDRPAPVRTDPILLGVSWFVVGVAALLSLSALAAARRFRSGVHVVGSLAAAAFGLLLAWHSGPWFAVGAGSGGCCSRRRWQRPCSRRRPGAPGRCCPRGGPGSPSRGWW
ncbi:beta-lactamase family protein [Propioniciclava coleopterorum]|uniref:Beta-lactamase family protein n=1 Tax=Propioniciclava coleopterorum TaxID=2714937 RepID=A0A6G7Y5J8_9ACTN|nr:serine hydrolase domain-containing protein [Propioniciclava coleopterorum]QIK71918.1 beta-lactamase family protein [Propioniciclava coleopterorum]